MELNFHWINLLILFGAIQGLVFGIVLLFNKKHPGAGFLSVFMFVLAYNGFETFNWSAGLDRYVVFFDLFPFIAIFGVGPALYLYVTSLLHSDWQPSRRKILLHFGLVFFQFGIRSAIIVYHLLWINKVIVSDVSAAPFDYWYVTYSEPLSVIVFLIYLIASILQFRNFQASKQIRFISREGQRIVYRWIRALLLCMTVLGIAWPLTVLAPYIFETGPGVYYYPIELSMVLFIYWIAMTGYHRTRIIYLRPTASRPLSVPDPESERQLTRVREAMETDKLYFDPELNLNKVASHIHIPAKTISSILNRHQQMSFNDFINGYRVREVCDRLGDPAWQHLTISGIAFESGFNSQATFQRAFKHHTGMSPRNFLAQQFKKTA